MANPLEAKQTGLRRWIPLVLLLTLAAAALRLLRLDVVAPSPFEGAMMLRISDGIGSIWRNRADSQAPLTDTLFWLAAQFPGDDLTNARVVSALAGAMALPLFWLAAAWATNRATALLLLLLLVCSPLTIDAAYTAEPISLALLALALCWLAFERLRRRSSVQRWLLLAVASLAATLTYAPLAIILAPMLLTLLLVAERRRRQVALGAGGTIALCGIGFLLIGGTTASAPFTTSDLLAVLLHAFTSDVDTLPASFEQVVRATLGIGALAALINWQQWEAVLPYFSQFAVGLVLLLVAIWLLGGEQSVVLLLPAGLLLVASGLVSIGSLRFGWPLAAVLAAVLLAATLVGMVDLIVQ